MVGPLERRSLLLFGIGILLGGCVVAVEPEVVAGPPPLPPPRVEAVPVQPGPTYVWVPGHWAWRPRVGYVWAPGHWAVPMRPGYVWVPGTWVPRGHGHVWVEGHWRLR
jgi:hypothetical protein